MIKKNGITFKTEGDNFVMEVDFSTWKKAMKNRPDFPIKITNMDNFKAYIEKSIKNDTIYEMYKDVGNEEVGLTMWMEILERIIEEAYENGEKWLKELEY